MYNSSRKIRNQKFVFLIVNTWITVTVPHLKVKVKINSLDAEEEKQTFLHTFLDPVGFFHNSSLGISSFLIGGTNLYVQKQSLKKSLGQWIFQKEHVEHFREKGISAENLFWEALWHFKSFPGLFFACYIGNIHASRFWKLNFSSLQGESVTDSCLINVLYFISYLSQQSLDSVFGFVMGVMIDQRVDIES